MQATLKGDEKTKPTAMRQTHTQGRFLVILTVRHIFLPYAKKAKKKKKKKKIWQEGHILKVFLCYCAWQKRLGL